MVVNSPPEVHDVMRRSSVLIILIAAALLGSPRSGRGQEDQPWLGTWSLQINQSGDQPNRYKRVTSKIEGWGDGLKVTYDMVGRRGGLTHWEWTGKFDGQDYPVQGTDTALTNAYRKIDNHSYEIVLKLDGSVVATSHVTVSPDGKTLTVATLEQVGGGKTVTTNAVYEKQ
jgi:hypothetical protein